MRASSRSLIYRTDFRFLDTRPMDASHLTDSHHGTRLPRSAVDLVGDWHASIPSILWFGTSLFYNDRSRSHIGGITLTRFVLPSSASSFTTTVICARFLCITPLRPRPWMLTRRKHCPFPTQAWSTTSRDASRPWLWTALALALSSNFPVIRAAFFVCI